MKRLCLVEDNTDYFSRLPYDLLDHICDLKWHDRVFLTMPGYMKRFQRCVRLSCVSKYHTTWLRYSGHYRESEALLLNAINVALTRKKYIPVLCVIIDKSETLTKQLSAILSNRAHSSLRYNFFYPMKEMWIKHICKSHAKDIPFNVPNLLSKLRMLKRPLEVEILELVLAFYHVYRANNEWITIGEPGYATRLYQLRVYDEGAKEKETSLNRQYFVTLTHDLMARGADHPLYKETRLDMRLFKSFSLVSKDYANKKVYAFAEGVAYGVITALEVATSINAQQRLRQALLRCYEAVKPKPKISANRK